MKRWRTVNGVKRRKEEEGDRWVSGEGSGSGVEEVVGGGEGKGMAGQRRSAGMSTPCLTTLHHPHAPHVLPTLTVVCSVLEPASLTFTIDLRLHSRPPTPPKPTISLYPHCPSTPPQTTLSPSPHFPSTLLLHPNLT